VKDDIIRLLEESGIGLPDYYRWRSRSGCYFCFFQRKYEWVMLAQEHPDLFEKAIEYEKNHKDGRDYTWTQGETLEELLARKDEIIENHQKSIKKHRAVQSELSLVSVLDDVLDSEDSGDAMPCLMCHS
jgi:hypothetical protein